MDSHAKVMLMKEYKLCIFLCVIMMLSLFGGACTPVSETTPPAASSANPAPAPAPDQTTGQTPLTKPETPPEMPAPTIKTAPGITAEDNHAPDSNEIDTGAVDELSASSGPEDKDKVPDSADEVAENDEANNEESETHSTPAPDLIIETITWSPLHPTIGEKVAFTVTIKNQGSDRADSPLVHFYIGDIYTTSASVSPLEPDATAEATFTWPAEIGSHAIKAVADFSNEVAENDETNNAKTSVFSTLGPDLIVQDITWSPANPTIGEKVTFTVTIKNQGNNRANSSRVQFYIGDSSRGYQIAQRIEADDTVTMNFTWTAQAGSYVIKAATDSLNAVNENDEANNEKTVTYSTPAPDLVVQNITLSPANPLEGNTVTFTVTLKNQGTGRAGYSHVAYYIDGTYQTSVYINQINPGATVTKTFTWTTQSGSHTVKAVADFYKKVAEGDETNNEKTVSFSTTYPDLVVQNITLSPASPSIGDTLTFTVSVKNQGGTRANPSHVCFYIDGSLRGSKEVQGIDAGATMTNTFTWTAKTGSHTIKAVADSDSEVAESNETNNERTVTFSGPSYADITIRDIVWSPANPSIGDTVTFTATIKNQGAGRTDYFYVAFYVDNTYITSVSTNPMAAGATATRDFTWTAGAGPHTVKAVADFHRSVAESDETNNEKMVTFSPLAPDLVVQDITWSPASPTAGDTVTFTVSIKNQGGYSAGYSLVAYYIDGSFTGYQDVQGVDAGSIVTNTFTWIAEGGTHAIRVVADMESRIPESNENNNENTVTFPMSSK